MNMSNKTKSLSEGEKIDFDAKWHNSVAASVGDKLKTTCTIFYCYKKLYATVIRLCQWTTNVCWIFKSELKVKTSWACFPDPSASKSINNGGCYINHSSIT